MTGKLSFGKFVDRTVTHGPVLVFSIKRFQAPALKGPVNGHGFITGMYGFKPVSNRNPASIARKFCAKVEVNARYKQMSSRANKGCGSGQATFRFIEAHMKKKAVNKHDVLLWKRGIDRIPGGITKLPLDAGLKFRLNSNGIIFPNEKTV